MLVGFEVMGYTVLLDSQVAPGTPKAERRSYKNVILVDRLYHALKRINPNVPELAIEAAIRKVNSIDCQSPAENNRLFRQYLINGVDVSYQLGKYKLYNEIKLIDYYNLSKNDWLAIQNFQVRQENFSHVSEVTVFINGFPLATIEQVNIQLNGLTVKQSFQKIQTSLRKLSNLFTYNQILVISNGSQARIGTSYSTWNQFISWHAIDGEDVFLKGTDETEIVIQDFFDKRSFFKLMKDFIGYEEIDEYLAQKEFYPHLCRA